MLHGRTVLVLGGNAGIGLAVARLAHENRARVVVASRSAGELAGELGPEVSAFSCDITDPATYGPLLEAAGTVDHLVVAVRPALTPAPFASLELDQARAGMDVKLWGACSFVQAALPRMSPQGSVTLTSGIVGQKISPGHAAMALIDAAVETLARALAVELAPIRVNAVSPGYLAPKPDEVAAMAQGFPAGRLGAAREAAASYLHLMLSPYVTGTVAVVDGGALLV
ncbi:MAG: SDR family oxidoreductase [Desulfarculaceae bacterium]|nr:SDR family oxidoreductase [Desulfarculaceae bacterium]MCF8071238.1 SDR family oxidoreductase [Desulfarculaceae bacterium]MCF8101159.1 SDR family oxidoreductase [Desulfarculaceae bacterium]MCF8115292.1 SDR family oxidoreductase [Desulfarculaceae bacterium]